MQKCLISSRLQEENIDAESPLIAEYGKQELHYVVKCIEQNTDNDTDSLISLWSSAGEAYMHVEDYEKAISCYLEALKYEEQKIPANTVSRLIHSANLGIAYACIQNKAMATQTLENYLTLVQEHYLLEHPKYEEITELFANKYIICYKKTDDKEYLNRSFRIFDLLLQTVENTEKLGFLEIELTPKS